MYGSSLFSSETEFSIIHCLDLPLLKANHRLELSVQCTSGYNSSYIMYITYSEYITWQLISTKRITHQSLHDMTWHSVTISKSSSHPSYDIQHWILSHLPAYMVNSDNLSNCIQSCCKDSAPHKLLYYS